jgi:hypothetical protein
MHGVVQFVQYVNLALFTVVAIAKSGSGGAIASLRGLLLFRFAVSFRPPSRRLSFLLGGVTLGMVGWTFALPDVPTEGESRPASFVGYVVAFTVHWTC